MPDDLTPGPAEAVTLADELLLAGRPFHAHEVLEAAWKAAPEQERDLWQGLAQIAVGLTHARRGNAKGAVSLLRRGSQRVRAYQAAGPPVAAADGTVDDRPYGIHVARVLTGTEQLAAQIDTAGLDGIPDAEFRLSLRSA